VRSTELINTHIDRVLATSHRTAEVLEKFGVAHDKIQVCYLGTEAAGSADPAERRYDRLDEDSLTIGYLGYLRRDKGFYFLLDALERAPDSLLARLRLVIAAVLHDEEVVERLTLLKERMQAIVLYDGYHHDQLGEILGRIDLGVIPVLWEDNLPQVAIEMVSAGLPLLTSDLGGAQELGGNNPAFVFEAGQAESLHQRLGAIADRRVELGRYWDQAMTPVTMSAHLEALDAIWTGRTPPAAAAPPRRPTAADGPRDPGTQRSASAPDVALRQERPTGHSVGDAGDATDSDSDGDGLSESGAAGEQTEPPEPEQPEPVQPEPVQPVERYASSEGAGPEPTSSDPKEDGAEDPEEGSAPPPPIEPGRPPTIERVTDPLPGRPHEKFKSAITLWTNHQQGEPGPPSDEGDPDARR